MNNLPRFVKPKNILRLVILALFIVSMLGPWMFDRLFIPAEYPCTEPVVRLEGDFCGYPMPGWLVFAGFMGSFFSNLAMLIIGKFTGYSQEFLMGLALIPLSPFFTTLILILKKETHRLRTVNLIVWTLALIPILIIFIIQIKDQVIRLWGLWVYILVSIGAVVFEVILLKRKTGSVPVTCERLFP